MTLHTTDLVAMVEIWAGIKNYVPAKDQKAAAEHYIATLDESGIVDLTIASHDMYGICDLFDSALRTYCEENGLIDDDLHDDDWEE